MAPPLSALNPVTRTPVPGSVMPGVYTGSAPPLPSTKPRLATVPPETVMKLLALSATPLFVANVVLRFRPPLATLLNRRLEKAVTVDCSVPSETSLSLLSSPGGGVPVPFCSPKDSSRVTEPLMVMVVMMPSVWREKRLTFIWCDASIHIYHHNLRSLQFMNCNTKE